jgi:hypothetical protein
MQTDDTNMEAEVPQADPSSAGNGSDQQSEQNEAALQELIHLKDEVSQLARNICEAIAGKHEPVPALNRLNYLLEAHFEQVWAMLLTPADKLYRTEKPEGSEIPMSGAASADAQPG